MMRSLFSGVSGLRTHQTRMDVIGNNIANVNTIGFKSSRMTFADAMSQRVSGASADNPETGRAGRNPMQIGLGVNVGGIDNIMTQGAAQRTDRALDAAIQGDGFFVVGDESGTFFTRAGNIDWNGNRFSINGMQLMGWNSVPDPLRPGSFTIEQGTVQPLVTGPETMFMNPRPTTLINAMGNLNVNDLVNGSIIRQIEFFDSLGNRYTADVAFTYHPSDEYSDWASDNANSNWSVAFLPEFGANGELTSEVRIFPGGRREDGISVNLNMSFPGDTGEPDGGRVRFSFDPNGNLLPFNAQGNTTILLNFEVGPLTPPSVIGGNGQVLEGFNTGAISFNMAGMRQHMGERTSVRALFADGNPSGTLQDVSIGQDGIIMGRYSNGEMRPLGQIPLAHFTNPEGMERIGNNLWVPSANSGPFDGVGTTGDLMPGALEMSNVEMSGEFTEMITTQRGFQASSRVITTSDEMLQELVNLKR